MQIAEISSIQDIVKSIPNKELEGLSRFTTFVENVYKEAQNNNFSSSEIAEILHVKKATVEKRMSYPHSLKEQKRNDIIGRKYLEAFSLLFQVSPLYLIGLASCSGEYGLCECSEEDGAVIIKNKYVLPMFFTPPIVIQKLQTIVRLLYVSVESPSNEKDLLPQIFEKHRLLEEFLIIADAKRSSRNHIKQELVNIPEIQSLMEIEIPYRQNTIDWELYCQSSWYLQHRHTISACQQALERLNLKDPKLLDLLFRLASANRETRLHVLETIEEWRGEKTQRSFYNKISTSRDENHILTVTLKSEINFDPKIEDPEERCKDYAKRYKNKIGATTFIGNTTGIKHDDKPQ